MINSQTFAALPATVERLQSAHSVVVLSGAGMSAESGVSTFRGKDGSWSRFRPEELASESGFRRNPVLVQSWYQERQRQVVQVAPNAGHDAVARLDALVNDVLVVTQNVDGLHSRAGSRNVIEVHGRLDDNYCIECRSTPGVSLAEASSLPHQCDRCDGLIRPGVVWFGEMLPDGAMERAVEAVTSCDVLISVGTSGVVYPVAGLPGLARQSGAYTIEVNIEPSALQDVMDDSLIGPSGVVLPELFRAVFPNY